MPSRNIKDISIAFPVICRSVAVFAIAYQLRLIASDLADTPVFITAVASAFFTAAILNKLKIKPAAAVITILLIPFVTHLLIAVPRFFVDTEKLKTIITFDSLLLNFDRNNFVSLLPVLWIAFSSYFAYNNVQALRFSVLADCVFLSLTFILTGSASILIYKLPIVRIVVFVCIVLFELASLMLASPPELKTQRNEKTIAAAFLVLLCAITGALLLRPMQEGALESGAGLIQPKLFSFDFAPFLRLENEISMSDDLIFIVSKDVNAEFQDTDSTNGGIEDISEQYDEDYEDLIIEDYDGFVDLLDPRYIYDDHFLMRRYVLSAYNSGGEKDASIGFFRNDEIDEKSQKSTLPHGLLETPATALKARRALTQDYYLVNIDGSAFIAMNEPVRTAPFESWDASSFKQAYRVESMVSGALPKDLINHIPQGWTSADLGMSNDEYKYYTFFGDPENQTTREKRITELSLGLTNRWTNYWEKIQALYEYLKFGAYRYSLKPGIAPDGDQLSYFLFDSKKGYCSYFAFAFASMLRSIGIPSRVAVGFFLDPQEDKLGFFPIRASMAHAWVEVFFPDYGWIEYDPTTKNLAKDEEFNFSAGIPPELFEKLLQEILQNRKKLKLESDAGDDTAAAIENLTKAITKIIKKTALPAVILIIIVVFVVMRFTFFFKHLFAKKIRRKTISLWQHIKLSLSFYGYKKTKDETDGGWTQRLDAEFKTTLFESLYSYFSAARFEKEYSSGEYVNFITLTTDYKKWQKTIPVTRRILSFICPPAALVLKPSINNAQKKPIIKNTSIILLMCFGLLFVAGMQPQEEEKQYNADEIFSMARSAARSEYWQRAIDLFNTGKKYFPQDPRFPLAAGDLYESRSLYRLAMDEYKTALALSGEDTNLIYKAAQTAGNLNENKESAFYLERLLYLDPANHEAIGSLGWMYFKLHRLKDGEQLLLDAIERFGNQPDFCMTLATIYSDMFRFNDSIKYYRLAISTAKQYSYNSFAAVAYYNLSILESRFYKYADSNKSSIESLAQYERASGHLARGEINLHRLDFKETFREYSLAYEMDRSPLSKVSLAQSFQIAGRLDKALAYALDCLRTNNLYWMLNYGIDPDQYKRDLHEILYKTYNGLANTEKLTIHSSVIEKVKARYTIIEYKFKSKIHKMLYQKYSLLSANSYFADVDSPEEQLDALKNYYNAFYSYKYRALNYLRSAKDIEGKLIPASVPSYLFEEAKLLQKEISLLTALEGFDPVWEQDCIADTFTELSLIAKKKNKKKLLNENCGRLFAMNPGAIRQNGLRLPVNIETEGISERVEKTIIKMLNKSGFIINKKLPPEARHTLRITTTGSALEVNCQIYDGGKGFISLRQNIPMAFFTAKDIAAFANMLSSITFFAGR
ncbi:hypothetical protein FACS1894190_06590 [Spirochaetia bacterium]|nr:hypothetical protein FACS1894190_06590 [Spirochaetia bacterium]